MSRITKEVKMFQLIWSVRMYKIGHCKCNYIKKNVFCIHSNLGNIKKLLYLTNYEEIKLLVEKTEK